MIRVARFVLGALALGLAATVGCLFPDPYSGQGLSGQGGQTGPCTVAQCDDHNPCTKDSCTANGCEHDNDDTAQADDGNECTDDKCVDGAHPHPAMVGKACGKDGMLTCDAKGGCSGCTNADQCGTSDECQMATCMAATCIRDFKPLGTKVVTAKLSGDEPGDCTSTMCDGSGHIVLLADAMDTPDDSMECTVGHCVDGKPVQTNSAIGLPCADGVTFCNATQSCVVCASDANCPASTKCYKEAECVSCNDGKKNGDETDADCGGPCGNKCVDGKTCSVNEDCLHDVCLSGKCVSCSDGIQNNSEGGVDCGGSCALKCKDGTLCSNAGDCESGQSANGFCCNLACTDPCTACDISPKEGTCSQVPKGHDDPASMCTGTSTCKNGSCVPDGGKNHFGQPCLIGPDCFSGICSSQTLTCN